MKITSLKRRSARAAHVLGTMLVAVGLVLSISTGTSLAFSTYESLYDESSSDTYHDAAFRPRGEKSSISPSSSKVDACLPLLESKYGISSTSSLDRNRRSAGKAAALGLVFGVRFALSPSKLEQASYKRANLGVWTTKGKKLVGSQHRSALAVTAYRHCQKQQALQALNTAG